MLVGIFSGDPLLPLLVLALLLHLIWDIFNLKQYLFQIFLTPQFLNPYLLLSHQHTRHLFLHFGIIGRRLLYLGRQLVDFLDGSQSDIILECIISKPIHPAAHLLVVLTMLLQILLELLIVVLNYLQFLLLQHLANIVEVALDTLYQTQYLLLQVLLSLLRLLQLHFCFFQPRRQFQSEQFFPERVHDLTFGSYCMLLAVSESTSEANAFPAGETDVGGLVEVEGTLSRDLSEGGFFCFAGGEETGSGETLRLAGGLLGRTIGFASLVPHQEYNNFRWATIPSYSDYNKQQSQEGH